jgi:hypothetical protein
LPAIAALLDDYIALVVNHCVQLLGRQSQQVTYLIGQRTEIPYVYDRNDQSDMSTALTAYLLFRNFDTASVTYYALVANALVLTAAALIVLGRAKDALAEEAVTLRLVRTVIDCFGLQYFSIRILSRFPQEKPVLSKSW